MLVRRCSRSPPAGLRRTWVVDNASSDGIGRGRSRGVAGGRGHRARAEHRLRRREQRRDAPCGVAARAAAQQRHDRAAGSIDALIERLESTGAVAAGPRLVDAAAGRKSRSGRCCRRWRRSSSVFASVRRSALERLGPALRLADSSARERDVDWVSGACLLVRRDAALAAGLFDERYFLYEEDVDFCAALRARGGRMLFTPPRRVVHLRGRSHVRPQAAVQPTTTAATWRSTRSTARLGARAARLAAAARSIDPSRISAEPAPSAHRDRRAQAARLRHRHLRPQSGARAGAAGHDDTYVLLCRRDATSSSSSARAAVRRARGARRQLRLREQISVPLALCRARVDLFHAPHYVVSPLTPARPS